MPLDRIPTLDHLGWICANLDAGAAAWERLGFTLSRFSPQMGFTGPGGALEPWASANRCAVFETGYLELIGIVDPTRHNPWTAYTKRGDGPHIAAFRVAEADAAYHDLAARVDGFDPPVQRRRMAPVGLAADGGEMEMRFRNIFSRDDVWPEGRFIVLEHQTPAALWQDELTRHPNGATALVESIFVAPDPAPTVDRLARLLDRKSFSVECGDVITAQGGGLVSVQTPAAFEARFPGAKAPDRPAVAAARIAVRSLKAVEALLAANGVELHTSQYGARFVHGPPAAGGVIAFTERAEV